MRRREHFATSSWLSSIHAFSHFAEGTCKRIDSISRQFCHVSITTRTLLPWHMLKSAWRAILTQEPVVLRSTLYGDLSSKLLLLAHVRLLLETVRFQTKLKCVKRYLHACVYADVICRSLRASVHAYMLHAYSRIYNVYAAAHRSLSSHNMKPRDPLMKESTRTLADIRIPTMV